MAQFLLEEACFELVAMQEHNLKATAQEPEETPAARHARMMAELRGA